MKKIFSILSLGLSALAVSFLAAGCVEEVPEVIEELNLSNVLMPNSPSATVSTADGHTVTFSWTNSNTATQYLIEIYQFETESAPASADAVTEEMLASMTPREEVVMPAESGSRTSADVVLEREYSYYARVCGQNRAEGSSQGDSKWAVFPYPIDTYTIMDPLASFTLTDRTSSSVSVEWTLAEDDEDGINQIRVSPNPDDGTSAFKAYPVSGGTTSLVIDGLKASTRYTVAAHFNSATRGTVFAWTRPSAEGAVQVSDTAAFKQALVEAADWATPPLKIQVAYNDGIPYEMGPMHILGPVEIFGEQTVGGESPVIIGYFNMRSPGISYTYTDYTNPEAPVENTVDNILGATSLRAEALSFSGNAYELGRNVTFAENFPAESLVSVEIINCEMSGYSNGMFYDNSKTVNFGKIRYESVYVSDISGDGGDNFDIRAENTIGSITMRNSTFTDGMRTFIRIDKATVNSFVFENNTVNNLVGIDNGNNKGLFNIRGTAATFEITDNLFLNLNGCPSRTVMFPTQATAYPTLVSGNYYYNLADTFFYDAEVQSCPSSDEFPQSAAIAGGGAVLTQDPCYNSERGIFNVTSAAVLAAEAGDPRWLTDYVEQPDPDLEPVEYGHTWDLTDTDTYYDVIDESCVRGNTRFIISSNPINVTEEGFEFTAEPASFEYSGVPTDCAMAFLVDGPGSVVLSSVEDGSSNDHITVAYGPADGTSVEKVAGAVYAGAVRTKVVFPDFAEGEQHLVYIYACGPVILSELSWTSDTETGGTSPLDTPSNVALSVPEASDGTVTLSWDAVDNAASYMIKWTGPVPSREDSLSVTENSHEFSVADLATGIYNFSVRADISKTDLSHEPSELSEAVKFIRRETLVNVSATSPTTWGLEDFTFMQQLIGSDQNTDPEAIWGDSFIYNNLEYYAGNTIRFANSDGLVCFQYPGSSNNPPNRRYLRFLAGGSGSVTVTFDATSSGRNLYVQTAGVSGPAHEAPNTGEEGVERGTFTETVTANAGDEIILWADASLRVFEITWTPEGYDPDATIPSDPEAIETAADIIGSSFTPDVPMTIAAAGQSNTINKVTYTAKSDKDILWDGERIKLQGASEVDGTGMPTGNVISFKITGPGTIKHYIRSGSSGDVERQVKIDLVKNGSEILNIYDAFAPTPGYKDGSEISTAITKEHLAGTSQTVVVNIYAPTNSVNVYWLEYIPDTL